MDSNYSQRLSEADSAIRKITDARIRIDLSKMYSACSALATELSKESVECRRIQRITAKYEKLEQEFDQTMKNLEYYLTFGILLSS